MSNWTRSLNFSTSSGHDSVLGAVLWMDIDLENHFVFAQGDDLRIDGNRRAERPTMAKSSTGSSIEHEARQVEIVDCPVAEQTARLLVIGAGAFRDRGR